MAEFIRAQGIQARHGFFTRRGGVSTGLFASLQCGIKTADDKANVLENRRRALEALGAAPDSLSVLLQIHSADVLTLDTPITPDMPQRGDAMVTRTPGLTLGLVTADCAPLLFHDPVAGVIGAAHSGWKGTLAGIGVATLEAMEKLGAQRRNISAAIGPCIAQESYEVGPEFPEPFIARGRKEFFVPSTTEGHFRFDLRGCIKADLEAARIGTVEVLPQDTYKDEAGFFSNRRATHRGEAVYGLQLSAIIL